MPNPERYATLQQCRDEGLTGGPSQVVTDKQVLILLGRASELVERLTRNLFYKVSGTFVFDGNNSYLLHLPIAIVEVDSLTINNETTPLASTDYRAYNGSLLPQDNRYNPKIELRRSAESSIFTGFKTRRFLKGYDQTIVGSFGYLDSDGKTPTVINECVIAIVMTTWRSLYERFGINDGGGGGPGPMSGPLKREKTDDHEVEWWQGDTGNVEQGLVVPQYIHGRLKFYRGPSEMRTTSFRFEYGEVEN